MSSKILSVFKSLFKNLSNYTLKISEFGLPKGDKGDFCSSKALALLIYCSRKVYFSILK
jgi:hypothetical protein